ncbi:MAG: hypothetical protein IT471_00595 [Pseudomonadales bacterium]|jgi:hypothetical protein|nr:hypothetical protein [Pseudomonadales bacterium]HMY96216.1 hypothetical protein [Pseudomonadales bacterium]HND26760.1 hypothetical protein [Pseudomonadales bacterium]HNL24534.1 hypothetical protein [Pseudomonadales bacterium]HNN66644.1 hypothetical protein [Pseudomonadales bacterium]
MMTTPIASGLGILQRAEQQLNRHANTLARLSAEGNTSEVNQMTDALTGLKLVERDARLGIKVIEAENQRVGSLLDILA